jgi:acyl-coenzyme A thioesterase PaaI-like protein
VPGVSDARFDAAAALRALANAFHAREVSDETLRQVAAAARDLTTELERGPRRERVIPSFDEIGGRGPQALVDGPRAEGMADRAIVGEANPVSVEIETSLEGDVAVARVVFGPAFEGAPGRVHGGMVAAVLDDISGYALAFVGEPGFTGTLQVVYRAPVPIERQIEFRTWVSGREGRKLYVEAEGRLDDRVLVTAKLTMILVDHEHFRTSAAELLGGRGAAASGSAGSGSAAS